MILNIVLSSFIDKTCIVEDLEIDGQNHIIDQSMNIGGEGIDCARTIKILQSEPLVVGFLGGLNGRYIKSNLDKNKIKSHFVWVNGNTRLNTTIIDSINGTKTIFYDSRLLIQEKDVLRLIQENQILIKDSTVVVLDGVLPKGISYNFYFDIINKAKEYNTKAVLSAEGEALRKGIEANPYGLKLSKNNLKDLNISSKDIKKILQELYNILINKSIHYIALDMGSKGIYTLSKNKICYLESNIEIEPVRTKTVASAFLGAFAVGVERKYEQEKFSKLATAASLSSMMYNKHDIICKKSDIDLLSKKVKVREVMNQSKGWLWN